jgi:hypothetical protein
MGLAPIVSNGQYFFMTPARSLILLSMLLIASTISAQTVTPTPTAVSTPSPADIAERALQLSAQFDERVLTTVYWCLGSLLTVFVFCSLTIGSSIFEHASAI